MPMVDSQAAPALVRAVAALLPFPCWFVQVTDKYPAKPYVLFSDPELEDGVEDQGLCAAQDTTTATLYVTTVDTTTGNVSSTRQEVRAALAPDRRGITLTLDDGAAFIKRIVGDGQPVQEDRKEEPDNLGRYPCFAVDAYEVHRLYN